MEKAYQEIADVFIQVEKDIYSKMLWEGFQPFKIEKIEQLSSDIKAFTVVSDQYDLSQFTPGEYITVDVSSEKCLIVQNVTIQLLVVITII